MPKTNRTTVSQNEKGQYQVTIPKALGDALDLAGEKVEWNIESSEKLSVEKVDDE
ncbi:MAG: hypothetical protein ACI8XM_000228 [Haloarculaceae archaeon]|jgi:hypothetical protein